MVSTVSAAPGVKWMSYYRVRINTLWWTNKKLWKMAIDIVDFPMNNGDFPWQNVSSPEGSDKIGMLYACWNHTREKLLALNCKQPEWNTRLFHQVLEANQSKTSRSWHHTKSSWNFLTEFIPLWIIPIRSTVRSTKRNVSFSNIMMLHNICCIDQCWLLLRKLCFGSHASETMLQQPRRANCALETLNAKPSLNKP